MDFNLNCSAMVWLGEAFVLPKVISVLLQYQRKEEVK